MQRDPLRAITSAYNTASTNCLSAVAGVLPLDLEIIKQALKRKLKLGHITPDVYKYKIDELLVTWQNRYVAVEKGEWTKKMIPSVAERYHLPLQLDYYTTQILTGHGDLKESYTALSWSTHQRASALWVARRRSPMSYLDADVQNPIGKHSRKLYTVKAKHGPPKTACS